MEINRENYEIYFVDYTDGTLSQDEIADLKIFLKQNPDLSEEFRDNEEVSLIVNLIYGTREDKTWEFHFKSTFVNAENFDEVCKMKINGQLNQAQRDEFEYYLKMHPEKIQEYFLCSQAIINPFPAIKDVKTVNQPSLFKILKFPGSERY